MSIVLMLQFSVAVIYAQKPDVRFRARGLFDLGYFSVKEYDDRAFLAIDDLRVGAKATLGRLEFKVDVGIVAKQIGIKDMIMEYRFDNSRITFGNAYEPFSMDAMISSMDFRFAGSSSAVQALASGRRFGFTYHVTRPSYYGAIGIYSDNSVNDLFEATKSTSAMSATTRQVYRFRQGDDLLVQAGAAFSCRSIDQSRNGVSITSVGFSPIWGEYIVSLRVGDARLNLSSDVELLICYKRFMIQAEMLATNILRNDNLPSYVAWGGYAQFSVLLNNGSYGYDQDLAIMTRPSKGALELTTRIDHLNANNPNTGLYGGRHTDLSLGLNYFFHQNISVKANVNYSMTDKFVNSVFIPNTWISTLRVQFYF